MLAKRTKQMKIILLLYASLVLFYYRNLMFRRADTVKENIEDVVKFTCSDPKFYIGPIVEGWPPNRNRDMELYIRPYEPIVTLISTSCLQLIKLEIDVLIFIQSAPEMSGRRDANRNTWMQYQSVYTGVKTLFIFGTTETEDKRLLQQEQDEHCDLIQLDFVDHYSNVTLDTVFAMKFALEQNWVKPPKFAMIGDDDVYINIPELWKRLFAASIPAVTEYGNTLWGYYEANPPVHFPGPAISHLEFIPRDLMTYCPQYMYNRSNYPSYLQGGGYIIPFHLTKCLYWSSLELPYFHINDVLVTGFARQQCGIKLDPHLPLFHDLMFHQIDDNVKYNVHKNLTGH